MNFFKSILADDPDPTDLENLRESEQHSPSRQDDVDRRESEVVDDPPRNFEARDDPNSSSSSTTANTGAGGWNFGGLIKTLASRSESVLETYRRDLEEFGSGLKKETELIRDAASRAVKELPATIEVGASVAHGSLGSVSKTIDGMLKSTAEIISQGKDTLLAPYDADPVTPDANRSLDSRRYSRFDAQLTSIQSDPNTFTEEPVDSEEYRKWKSEFYLNDKRDEFMNLIGENIVLEGVYRKLVPSAVDEDTFWYRYYYRVHKLKQQESVRANLVRRAISVDEEEVLSWDFDDEDEANNEKSSNAILNSSKQESKQAGSRDSLETAESITAESDELRNVSCDNADEKGESEANADSSDKDTDKISNTAGSSEISSPKEKVEDGKSLELADDAALVRSVEKGCSEGECSDHGASGKHKIVSSQQSVQEEEEDFGWDEIEDIESSDEKKVSSHVQSANRDEVRKRLAEEDDENLSWDIEDDDEPVQA
ncbi:unnamed protein product [Cuscuta campestris]|uniref:BSD domain-containing protein n=1 Tax=Cuscuta campestris TaxID=132261 RepID=A0A484LN18_9ASTE|nr:unnamed protein product [Cuscuta campestris]